jgi:probable HAF family extracellular repeat protein
LTGKAIGWSFNASRVQQAFLFENGVMTDLGTLPGDNQSIAQGINNRGQVAGYSAPDSSVWHAVLWTRER